MAMAPAATTATVRVTGPEPAPVVRREITLTVPCRTCDTLVRFDFSVEADSGAYGGVFHRGPTWDYCPDCGAVVAVTGCADGEHRMTELRSGGQSLVACLVCGPRYRPVPLKAIRVLGGEDA